jgi:hypothetical protein
MKEMVREIENSTAVEWLRSKMLIECLEPSDELFEQAKAMEKQQIEELKNLDKQMLINLSKQLAKTLNDITNQFDIQA